MQVKREVGDVSILVNNAGIVTGKKFMDAPDSLIEKTVEVNTMAHFWVSHTKQTLHSCVVSCGSVWFLMNTSTLIQVNIINNHLD